ncbi:MAG: NAD(P)H-dependent oxidoreductase, partial [Burkholderiales bacterium]|nr:NAD(P)H-dependent oxidoreductase [Burkholderiales bacterium]
MPTLLHLDSSARSGLSGADPHGSHTRRLSARFVKQWQSQHPQGRVIYRDLGAAPPAFITGQWIHAAFTPVEVRELWMHDVLAESDLLISELLSADVIVAGVPMYNFGPPAQ